MRYKDCLFANGIRRTIRVNRLIIFQDKGFSALLPDDQIRYCSEDGVAQIGGFPSFSALRCSFQKIREELCKAVLGDLLDVLFEVAQILCRYGYKRLVVAAFGDRLYDLSVITVEQAQREIFFQQNVNRCAADVIVLSAFRIKSEIRQRGIADCLRIRFANHCIISQITVLVREQDDGALFVVYAGFSECAQWRRVFARNGAAPFRCAFEQFIHCGFIRIPTDRIRKVHFFAVTAAAEIAICQLEQRFLQTFSIQILHHFCGFRAKARNFIVRLYAAVQLFFMRRQQPGKDTL